MDFEDVKEVIGSMEISVSSDSHKDCRYYSPSLIMDAKSSRIAARIVVLSDTLEILARKRELTASSCEGGGGLKSAKSLLRGITVPSPRTPSHNI